MRNPVPNKLNARMVSLVSLAFFFREVHNVPVCVLCIEPAGRLIGLARPRGIILVPNVKMEKPNGKPKEAKRRCEHPGTLAIFSLC
jgi:hypothetical protein